MKRTSQAGFSLIEVIITFSILAVATTALGLVELSNARRTQYLKQKDIAFARGQAVLERVLRIPFGTPGATAPTPAQLDLLFGSDDDARAVTLTMLQQHDVNDDGTVDQQPWSFKLQGVEEKGVWTVHVDSDLDGNGKIEPTITQDGLSIETREGRADILRVEVRRDGKTVLKTLRARTPQEQDDTSAPLGGGEG